MTDKATDVTVTQADREAAVSAYESERIKTAVFRINIALGCLDDNSLVQAFARHRTAHSGEVERLRGALERIAAARITGWGAEGAVKSFEAVKSFARAALEQPETGEPL